MDLEYFFGSDRCHAAILGAPQTIVDDGLSQLSLFK
jgi:hypothetical protein